jgi:hypothetical protein
MKKTALIGLRGDRQARTDAGPEGPDKPLSPPDRAPSRQLRVAYLLMCVGMFVLWGLAVYFLLGLFM